MTAAADRTAAHRIAEFVNDHWISAGLFAFPVIGGIGWDLLGGTDSLRAGELGVWEWAGAGIVAGASICHCLTAVASVRRGKKVSALERIIDTQKETIAHMSSNLFSYVNNCATDWAMQLGFGSNGGNRERITIYAHDSRGYFTAFARYSANPEYKRKSRGQYEFDSGCIGAAWRDSWYFKRDYPDPQDAAAWIARCRRDGLKHEVAAKIRMKSRLYCGFRIDSIRREPLAVVVVESTDPDRYSEDELRTFFNDSIETMRAAVEHFAPSLPRVAMAREAGF